MLPTRAMKEPNSGTREARKVTASTSRILMKLMPRDSGILESAESLVNQAEESSLDSAISWMGCIITGKVNASATQSPSWGQK